MSDLRLTAAQAAVRWLAAQSIETNQGVEPYFAGVWAIFGHGNVGGMGEALHAARAVLPTYRAHNEQAMALAAIAFAKQSRRRRAMVCTTSIGPGATNLVTAAALAHVNRLPLLLLPGDVYASRRPDPVLQQVESFADATVSANDCLRPVSRYFDRITRPEQLLDALPRALATLLDPVTCGPATLAFCQDVQAEAFDWPADFFAPRSWRIRAPAPDTAELQALARLIRAAQRPLIIAGGGVAYAGAEAALAAFCARTGVPVAETQAGKGALTFDQPLNLGAIGVTGTAAANAAAAEADLIIGLGTRLQDFTTGSRALISARRQRLVQVNVAAYDAHKHGATTVVGDALAVLASLHAALEDWRAPQAWTALAQDRIQAWSAIATAAMAAPTTPALPTDAQVLGAVARTASADAIVVCAAGGLPGELHKLWRTRQSGGYHVEYGYSCMGYEIAGGLGVKMAEPARETHVLVGDGSYLMMNSELATSVMLGRKLIVTVLDNRGFGCISRLQHNQGGEGFNNLLDDCGQPPPIDFAAHARSLGCLAEKVEDIAGLEAALARAQVADRTSVIVIDTDPDASTSEGGAWWDAAPAAVSSLESVSRARADYDARVAARDQSVD